MRKRLLRGGLAVAGATTLALVGAVGAIADPEPGNIDQDEGSLTIHKYLGAHTNQDNDGSEITITDRNPGVGIKFNVSRVGVDDEGTCTPIDLKTPAGWESAADAIDSGGAGDLDGYCYEAVGGSPFETNDDGEIEIFNLPVGLYWVEEVFDSTNKIVEMADPFYVTVPFPTEGEWNYGVHVYPKNIEMGDPGKYLEGDPNSLSIGAEVQWRITSIIPDGATLTEASVYDNLDPRLSYVSSTVKLVKDEESDVALTEDVHYKAEADSSDEQKRSWDFVTEGLGELNDHQGWTLEIVLTTEVTSMGVGDDFGVIGNTDYGVKYNDAETPGNGTPYRFYGALQIRKVGVPAGSDTAAIQGDFDEVTLPEDATTLADAEFQVFPLGDDDAECPSDMPSTDLISTGTTTESDPAGVADWSGLASGQALPLYVGQSYFEDQSHPETRDYCVYETVAPAGFTAFEGPLQVTIKAGDADSASWTIPNVQKGGPDLPLTGSAGTVLLILAGSGIILLGVGSHLVRKKKARAAH